MLVYYIDSFPLNLISDVIGSHPNIGVHFVYDCLCLAH